MVNAKYHSLEMSPKAFNRVGSATTIHELSLRMVDVLMVVTVLFETVITLALIGEDGGIISNELSDIGTKCFCLGIGYNESGSPARPFSHTEDSRLGFEGLALRMLSPFGLMLVLLPAAKIHFVTLNLSAKSLGITLSVQTANLVENVPSSLLRDADVTA